MDKINLPDYCKTVEELAHAGIVFQKPVVDMCCRRALGKTFFIFSGVTLFCLAVVYVNKAFIHFISTGAACMLLIIAAVCACYVVYLLICYLFCTFMRGYLKRRVCPVMLEPVGVAVEIYGGQAVMQHGKLKCRSYIIYREAGVRNTVNYYASAPYYGIPENRPTGTAFLFRHPDNRKFYTVDNEREQNVIRVKRTVSA